MSEFHIGRLIKGFRESKKITQKELYNGLRRQGEIYKIEGEDQDVPKLLVDILFERMGLSTDIYGYVFSMKEYELFQCRADILELLEDGKWEEAGELCNEYEGKISKKDKLENQYIDTIRLLISMEKGASPEYLLEEVRKILFLSVPEFESRNIGKFFLSGMERMLVAMQAEALCQMEGREEEGMDLYYSLLQYIEDKCTDFLEKERQIPPVVLLMVKWLWKWEKYGEMWICEKAIKTLRNNMRLSLLEPIMRYEMKAWEKGLRIPDDENPKIWEEALKALKEIREEYHVEEKYGGEYKASTLLALMIKQDARGQIMGDIIRRMRKEKGLSIEELAENICEPEHLRKIELGYIRPRQHTYSEIMKKLGQTKYAYHPLICSEDYKMYECCKEIKKYIYKFEYEKAEYELRKLEKGLDCNYEVNYQIILRFQAILREKIKQITLEERLEYLKKALKLTVPDEVELGNWPLNREETTLWNNIASTLELMEKREEAVNMLQNIKSSYEQNKVKSWNYKQEYMMILCNLSTFLGREERYKEAIEIVDYAIPLAIKWEEGNYLTLLLYNKICNIEESMEKENMNKKIIEKKCFLILKQNFSIANIIQYRLYKYNIKEYFKEYYNILISQLF